MAFNSLRLIPIEPMQILSAISKVAPQRRSSQIPFRITTTARISFCFFLRPLFTLYASCLQEVASKAYFLSETRASIIVNQKQHTIDNDLDKLCRNLQDLILNGNHGSGDVLIQNSQKCRSNTTQNNPRD